MSQFAHKLGEPRPSEPSPDAVGLTIFCLACGVCGLAWCVARWVL